jgi:HrpA-like RNA helicase
LSIIVSNGLLTFDTIAFMDNIPEDSLWTALEKLHTLGAITTQNLMSVREKLNIKLSRTLEENLKETTTEDTHNVKINKVHPLDIIPSPLGILMNKFYKISIENIKMLLYGYSNGANILHLISIIVCTEIKKIFKMNEEPSFEIYINELTNNANTNKYANVNQCDENNTNNTKIIGKKKGSPLFPDQLINMVLIFEEFMSLVSNNKLLHEWIEANNINYEKLLEAVSLRDELIENIATAIGLNPFAKGSSDASMNLTTMINKYPDFAFDEIKKIKECIYEGYKLNIATLNDDGFYYIHNINQMTINEINTKKNKFPINLKTVQVSLNINSQLMPKYIIYQSIVMIYNNKSESFNLSISGYSPLDGFVDPDLTII